MSGSAEAYRFFLISIELMYKFGAAIWLNRLGYKFEKVSQGYAYQEQYNCVK